MAPRKAQNGKVATKATPKKRVAANGYKLPDPIEEGEILTDLTKKQWRLGRSIGQGGFGEIYLASDNVKGPVGEGARYVVKVEYHSNGPLFTEIHCYMRIGKPEIIDAWMKEKRLTRLGMPRYYGSGSHVYQGQKYRFMVMERFDSDIQKILEKYSKMLSYKTVFRVAIQILDTLEYIHSKEYIHADIKASNLLLGYHDGIENQVYLVDYGLACRYAYDRVHKPYKYDRRKAHDGTIEFTSRDAHIGAHSRRGDLEILGYNIVQWLCGRLPWEDKLQDCDYVATQKRYYMEHLDKFMSKCFPSVVPPGVREYLDYITSLTFDEKPDYEKCHQILLGGLKAKGYKDEGKLVFTAITPKPGRTRSLLKSKSPKVPKRRSEEEENLCGCSPAKKPRTPQRNPCRPRNYRIHTRRTSKKSMNDSLNKSFNSSFVIESDDVIIEKENQKMKERELTLRRLRPRKFPIKKDTCLDNPTPQMLAVMARMREKSSSPPTCMRRHRHNSTCGISRSSPTYNDTPTEFTPEMEEVMQMRSKRLLRSTSHSYDTLFPGSTSPLANEMFLSESEDSNNTYVSYSSQREYQNEDDIVTNNNSIIFPDDFDYTPNPYICRELANLMYYASPSFKSLPTVSFLGSRQTRSKKLAF